MYVKTILKGVVLQMPILMNIANVIVHCLEMCMTCFFFYHVLTPKYSFKKIYSISCLIASIAVLIAYTDYPNILFRQIIIFLSFLILCKNLYKDSFGCILFFICISYTLMTVCDLIITFSLYSMFPEAKGYPEGKFLLFGNMLWIALYTFVIYIFLIIWKKEKNVFLPKKIYITVLFPLGQFFIMHAILYYSILQFLSGAYQIGIIFCILGSVICLYADITLFQVILDNSKKERLAAQIEVMNTEAYWELEYYNSINEKMQEIRKIRHDFNNQLQTAYNMIISEKERGEQVALQLLKQLRQQIEEATPIYYCSNLIVNVILAEKVREAKEQGIFIDVSVEFPENTILEKVDLCSVFSNLLDNAIHATALTEGQRTITVRTWFQAGYCIIKVTNPFSPVSSDSQPTTKKTDKLHGYGLYILDAIAQKYHGEFNTHIDNLIFTANIKLKASNK